MGTWGLGATTRILFFGCKETARVAGVTGVTGVAGVAGVEGVEDEFAFEASFLAKKSSPVLKGVCTGVLVL